MILCHGDTELSKEDLQLPLDGKAWYTLPRESDMLPYVCKKLWIESFQRITGIRESMDFKNFMSTKCTIKMR